MPMANRTRAAATIKAHDMKLRGNKLYLSGDLTGAIDCYRNAFELDPLAVYLSNLSAAQFELGRYEDAVSTISNTLRLSENQPSPDCDLAAKLLLRSAKANLCLRRYDRCLADIKSITGALSGTSSKITQTAIKLQTVAEQESSAYDAYCSQEMKWKKRVLGLPRYKSAPDPRLEYYVMGQDYANSIMTAQNLDCCDNIVEEDRMRMKIPDDGQPFDFSALFGGVGDARNLYSTLHDIDKQLAALRDNRVGNLRFHFSLSDIHPTALARDIVVLFTLVELAQRDNDAEMKSPQARRLLAMLHFVYLSNLIPPSLHDMLMERIRSIHREFSHALSHNRPVSRSWIYIHPNTVKSVNQSLEWWLGDGPKAWVPSDMIPNDSQRHTNRANMSPYSRAQLSKAKAAQQERLTQMLGQPEAIQALKAKAEKLGIPYEEYLRSFRKDMLDGDTQAKMAILESPIEDCLFERDFYGRTRISFPLEEVEEPLQVKRALGVAKSVFTRGMDSRDPNPEHSYKHLSKAERIIKTRAMNSWKPNITLLDRNRPDPDIHGNGFESMDQIFVSRHLQAPKGKGALCLADWSAVFFGKAADAFRRLFRISQDSIKIEIVDGDVWDFVEGVSYGTVTRPSNFPTFFDRLHFSNVPDYTGGPATMFALASPMMKPHPQAYMTLCCLLNTPYFGNMTGNPTKNNDSFLYHYTATVANDLPSIFGLELVNEPHPLAFYMTIAASDSQRQRPVSRAQLLSMLYGLFVRCALPPHYRQVNHPHSFVMQPRDPLNLHSIFRMLRFLGRIQPAHVLGDFVSSILENHVVTFVRLHEESPIPIPSERGQSVTAGLPLCCSPFQAEFEVAAALWRPLLPFPILCSVPCPTDIKVYTIAFKTGPQGFILGTPQNHMTLIAVVGSEEELKNATKLRAFRNHLQGDAGFGTTLNLISTFEWQTESSVVHIPLTRARVDSFRSKGYSIAIMDTMFWCIVSSLEPCSKMRATVLDV